MDAASARPSPPGMMNPYGFDPVRLPPQIDESLLIMPKKLPNPVLESQLHRNMHREMRINRKLGVNVLNQKGELDRVFREKKREDFKDAPVEKKSDFQMMLEKRRKAQEGLEKEEIEEKEKPEFLKIRNRLVKDSE